MDKTIKFNGKICAKHADLLGERYVVCGKCVGCKAARYKAWYLKVGRRKDERLLSKEKQAIRAKRWRLANQERCRQKNNEWVKNNPEKRAANCKLNVILRRKILGGQQLAKSYRKEIAEIYKNRPEGHDVDHIVPLRGTGVCGLHVPWNLQYLPSSENRKKSNLVQL